jgi:glycosidase
MKYCAYILSVCFFLGIASDANAKTTFLPAACAQGRNLHVASPDWRDQIIYFLMLDRFEDGDPSNNDQGAGEYRPKDPSRYSGGDIKGVTKRLDYIQSLGATTVWTTPPVANQWWSKEGGYGGYHGYWARDFSKIDEHNGNMQDYQELACSLHQRDMFLAMDIVVNHTGDFFNYDPAAISSDPSLGYSQVNPASPSSAPLDYPFNLNDPRRAQDRAAAIYNWTPELKNYYDRQSELTQQLAKLDDINTKSPLVRAAFKDIFGRWIKQAGVDAFRVDTVKYVEPDFFEDFIYAPDGILKQAAATGRKDFFIFGEVKENAPAFTRIGEAKMQQYFGTQERPSFPSLINFPLQEEMLRVFGQGSPTAALTYRLNAFMQTHPDATLATNFVDNHDMPRFLSQGSVAAFKQAMTLIFALPGIPMIYQGNEQAVTETRQAMFKGGFGADKDYFDTNSELFKFIQKLAAIRKAHPALRRGTLTLLADNPNLPGVFAFRRDLGNETIFIIFNTAEYRSLLAAMPTGLASEATLMSLLGNSEPTKVGRDGLLTLALAPREIRILAAAKQPNSAKAEQPAVQAITIDGSLPDKPLFDRHILSGQLRGSERLLKLVLDGDLDNATDIRVDKSGRWQAILEARDVGVRKHVAQIYAPISGEVSAPIPYSTERKGADWQVKITDAVNDDKGPDGNYLAPTDPSFKGQQDIVEANIRSGGDILELELKMRATSADWYPANGFDHVAISTFFQVPGQKGLPQSDDIKAAMPEGFGWSAAHTVFGWGNSLILAPNQKVGRAPAVKADHERKAITISYSAASLGLKSWRGIRLYVTTFDREGEGGFRRMTPEGGPMVFRGNPAGPKIMDDMLISIP